MAYGCPVPGVPVVNVIGQFRSGTCDRLWAVAYPLLTEPTIRWAVFNLRDAEFSDAAPYAMLTWFHQHLKRRGGGLVLMDVPSRIARWLDITDGFEICDDVDQVSQMLAPRLMFPGERPACLQTVSAVQETWFHPLSLS